MAEQITFTGTPEEQELARQVFNLMLQQGSLFAAGKPIRQTLSNLTAYFMQTGGLKGDAQQVAARLDMALSQNPAVFRREQQGQEVVFLTSKRGAFVPSAFQVRRPEHRYEKPLPEHTFLDFDEPVVVPDVLRPGARLGGAARPPAEEVAPTPPAAATAAPPERPRQITPAEVPSVDLTLERDEVRRRYGDILRTLLVAKLKADPRFVHFGDEWYLDELLVKFSKGDMRRLREYIADSGQAETDTTLLAEVLDKHPYEEDYERYLFSLNYRLSEDPKTFEFKGVAEEYLWAVSETPSYISERRGLKLQDVGNEYRFLERGAGEPARAEMWTHTLTYFEWENGVLPYDQAARAVLPPPFLEGQRAAILEFRLPQWSRTLWCDLRYPISGRGGWVDGLEDVWQELFVPGARLTLERTDRSNVFVVTAERVEPETVSLLRYDERHGRFTFVEVTVNYRLDDAMTLSESRFAGLEGTRRLSEWERRQADAVIAFAFEHVGIPVDKGGRDAYWAGLEDLLPIVNIEKPFTREYLLSYLDTQTNYARDDVADGYYLYFPG